MPTTEITQVTTATEITQTMQVEIAVYILLAIVIVMVIFGFIMFLEADKINKIFNDATYKRNNIENNNTSNNENTTTATPFDNNTNVNVNTTSNTATITENENVTNVNATNNSTENINIITLRQNVYFIIIMYFFTTLFTDIITKLLAFNGYIIDENLTKLATPKILLIGICILTLIILNLIVIVFNVDLTKKSNNTKIKNFIENTITFIRRNKRIFSLLFVPIIFIIIIYICKAATMFTDFYIDANNYISTP